MGTNIIMPARGNGNFFTFIAIGTIMNIMVISVILKNWNRSQNTYPDQ